MIDSKKKKKKKEIEKAKNLSGEERGIDIKYLVNCVIKREGNKGLRRVMTELKKNGYELPPLDKINNMDWIPISIPTIFLVASVKCFNWQEKDIIQMGKEVLSFSNTLKVFVKYFFSIKKTFKLLASKWNKYYSIGEFSIKYDSQEKNKIIIYLKNFEKHPFTCLYLMGTFSGFIEVVTGKKVISAKETKCPFRGGSYHEFEIYWK